MPRFQDCTLRDPSSELTATFVPSAGMIGTSLSDGGVELLGLRRGLQAYVAEHKTMGIPLLYPWANRLSSNRYRVGDTEVTLTPGSGGVHTDAHGAPIHGTLAGDPGWQVTEQSASMVTAELDFGSRPDLLASFPFPHLLRLAVRIADRTLTVRTRVTATTEAAVPLCFGFHPYLQLPGVPGSSGASTRRRCVRGSSMPAVSPPGQPRPTRRRPSCWARRCLMTASTTWPRRGVRAVRRWPTHRGALRHGLSGGTDLRAATEDVICFEPMAAPTDALRRGGYPVARLGTPGVAQFSIYVR